ncbi:MAG TPA: AgmX/PglI C-terminal domain-containing protein [Steroidobacteraceae bacterium]|nr:AgmX/PglI C-terminal domain-containing protein [Steroidobacteraceae bacterium]
MTVAVAARNPYRRYVLPWTPRQEEQRRSRRITRGALGAAAFFALIVSFVPLPPETVDVAYEVPERLVKLVEQKLPPPPPPPAQRVEPVEPVEQPVEAVTEPVEPVEAPRAHSTLRETPTAQPKPTARERASRAGLLPLQDRLAALRENAAVSKAAETRNLTGKVGETTRAERSLVTSQIASGSGGIDTAALSRGYGSGGGALEGHDTTQVQGSIGASGGSGGGGAESGAARSGGAASRSREEIELVFDRNKSAIYALYSRALRTNPQLQGKLVLELTIAPDGRVTDCQVVSSELNDAELEKKLVARVKMFRFEARDVATVTTTKPIDFFPA